MAKNSNLLKLYKINFCQVVIFRLYTVYNKHEIIKIGNQIRNRSLTIQFTMQYADCRLASSSGMLNMPLKLRFRPSTPLLKQGLLGRTRKTGALRTIVSTDNSPNSLEALENFGISFHFVLQT